MSFGGCLLQQHKLGLSLLTQLSKLGFDNFSPLPRAQKWRLLFLRPLSGWVSPRDDWLFTKPLVIFVLGTQHKNELYCLCRCRHWLLLAEIDCSKWSEFPPEGNSYLFELPPTPYFVCINYPGQKRNLPGPCLSCGSGAYSRGWITPHMDLPPSFLVMNNHQSSGEGIKK